MTAPAALITATYRVRLSDAMLRQARDLDRLWSSVLARDDPVASLEVIGAAAGPAVAAGQVMFIAEALAYIRALTADAAGVPLGQVAPYALPPGVAGIGASGAPVSALTGLAPRVFEQRRAQGWGLDEAIGSARSWVGAVAASEPYRAANQTVLHNAGEDERLTGRVNRIPEPDACAFCELIADRGYLPSRAGFAAHAHCRCTASPEISSHVYSRAQLRYARRVTGQRVPRVPAQRPAPPGA